MIKKSNIKNQSRTFSILANVLSFKGAGWSVILIFAFCILNFSGCAKREDISVEKTITVWHWMTDREETFLKLAKSYEEATGVRVKFELYAPSEAYSQKVRAAAQAKTLPTIFGILGEKRDFASFIKAGHVVNLSSYMEEEDCAWRKVLFKKALAVNEFLPGNEYGVDAGVYGVPIDVTNIQMLYNKKLFEKAGLDPQRPPITWKEFIKMAKKLKASGIGGLVSGWGEIWMIDCFASNYAFNIMGEEKVIDTIKGKIPYTDPDWLKVFSLFKEMADNGVLYSGIVTMVNKNAEQLFANQRAAFAFNGSWCVNVYYGMNPTLDYAAMLPPKVSFLHPLRIWGGAGSSFLVNERSKEKIEAIKFLRWLTQKQQQIFLSRTTKNLPSNKESLQDIPQILAQFADDMDSTTHPSVWPVHEFPTVIEAFDKGIQSIIIGEKTPEQVAEEVQRIKERELAKKKTR